MVWFTCYQYLRISMFQKEKHQYIIRQLISQLCLLNLGYTNRPIFVNSNVLYTITKSDIIQFRLHSFYSDYLFLLAVCYNVLIKNNHCGNGEFPTYFNIKDYRIKQVHNIFPEHYFKPIIGLNKLLLLSLTSCMCSGTLKKYPK